MAASHAPPLVNGQLIFDRYRLKALVGRGAVGAVWRAFDQELEIDIALKFLGDEYLFDPVALADLKRETRRGLALAHPHILRIYGFFQAGGLAAIAMEFIEGNTLAALQAARRPRVFDVEEIAEWTRQLCGALSYAHTEALLIHRDLKPGNLMIDGRGRLKVADFGIAASVNDARSRLGNAPDTSGTPSYMSPQQLLGQRPGVEHDIYSLGATLYDLLTGRPPFHSGDISLQVRTVIPPSITERRAENGFTGGPVPPKWEETIAACLAKDASLRPPSAAQVAEQLGLGGIAFGGTTGGTRNPHASGAPFASVGSAPTVMRPSGGSNAAVGAGHPSFAAVGDAVFPSEGAQSGSAAAAPPKPERRRTAAALITTVAITTLVAALGVFAWRQSRSAPKSVVTVPAANAPEKPPAPAAADKSIAVLAFKNLSGDPAREFFSDGLSEALAEALGRVPGLRVAGSASAFAFKGKPVPNPEIARQLGVAYLLEGTVRQDGKFVRITARLINADGFQMWVSDNLDRELKSIFALHDELAGLIATHLSLELGAARPGASPAVDPRAFELYLQGRQALAVLTRPAMDRAAALLKQALELDPKFARTYAALADLDLIDNGRPMGGYGREDSPIMQRVVSRIDQALALDPNLAEAHASRGFAYFLKWQFADSVRELRRSIALNPNYANAHQWLAQTLRIDGWVDEALEESKLAARLDPLSPAILDDYTAALIVFGRYEEALRVSARSLEIRPKSSDALFLQGRILLKLNRVEEGLANIPKLDPVLGHERRMLLLDAGRTEEAAALLPAKTGPRRFIELAALSRLDESLAVLTQKRFNVVDLNALYFDPVCAGLRGDPRIAELLAEIGQREAFVRVRAWWAAHPRPKQ